MAIPSLLLATGPTLYNHLTVHQSVTLPKVDLSCGGDAKVIETPHGLKQRWKPFGYSKWC